MDMETWLIAGGAAGLWAAGVLVHARFWPYSRCPACYRRPAGRGIGSTPRAYRRCRRCGGTGERIRPLAKIYPRWREEARRERHEW